MTQTIDTVIIGGGQAGLATGYFLRQFKREFVILEQASQAGNAWRNDRWDSFALLTPNWSFRLPGAEYNGPDPDGFMPRAEIVTAFEQYIDRYRLPVQYQTKVKAVEYISAERGYRVTTNDDVFLANQVVVATGLFQRPKIPAFAARLTHRIEQIHSGHYRNPGALPAGAVLVVGSGQSGCQIAEELYQNGRKVFLCTGRAGRAPRRYRGKDVYEWLNLSGFLDRTVDKLPSPRAKFAANPQVSGRDGGHSLNLHQFAHDGVMLLGRLLDANDHIIRLASDLKQNLAEADRVEGEIVKMVDAYIAKNHLAAPEERLPALREGFAALELTELDVDAAGITTVIWAMGYHFDFNWVYLPIFDSDGYPIQQRGVTESPGLYFVGLPWLHKQKSGLLVGVGEDAEFVAGHIAARS